MTLTITATNETNDTRANARPSRLSSFTYTRFELVRTFRNRRFMIFSLAFPLVLFFLVAAPNRHEQLGGINFATRYMVGMLGWGAMAAVIAGGARIAQERSVGWHRQLRITPLSMRTYFATKVLSAYALASLSIVLLYAAGLSVGVRLGAVQWLELTGYVLIALVPFTAVGIILGHLLTVDSMGPALGGITSLFAILGGAWGPIASAGVLHSVVRLLPSYWLVQAGNVVVGGGGWPAQAWIVIAVWTLASIRLAVLVYRRDTARV
jgi:ABC-2 type transport system permease protein